MALQRPVQVCFVYYAYSVSLVLDHIPNERVDTQELHLAVLHHHPFPFIFDCPSLEFPHVLGIFKYGTIDFPLASFTNHEIDAHFRGG